MNLTSKTASRASIGTVGSLWSGRTASPSSLSVAVLLRAEDAATAVVIIAGRLSNVRLAWLRLFVSWGVCWRLLLSASQQPLSLPCMTFARRGEYSCVFRRDARCRAGKIQLNTAGGICSSLESTREYSRQSGRLLDVADGLQKKFR